MLTGGIDIGPKAFGQKSNRLLITQHCKGNTCGNHVWAPINKFGMSIEYLFEKYLDLEVNDQDIGEIEKHGGRNYASTDLAALRYHLNEKIKQNYNDVRQLIDESNF
ncbi:hypothetical protein M8C21_008505, partial [Ambrosia artemisiifolia]